MPKLIIIAGCNGAGKSTFAPSFLPDGISSFDYDKLFLKYYDELSDSEFREKFAKDKTTKDFEQEVTNSLLNKTDFCYETNFDTHPLYWAERFKKHGFKINLIFFCIENQEIVRHRIQVRAEFKGHFVDNSKPNEVYTNILQIENGLVELMADKIPDYFNHRLPNIYNFINSSTKD